MPVALAACEAKGLAMLRGTLPSAARWTTESTPERASSTAELSKMEPSTRRTSSRTLSLYPVEKSSRITTSCPARSAAADKFDPMKPAPPVIAIRTWWVIPLDRISQSGSAQTLTRISTVVKTDLLGATVLRFARASTSPCPASSDRDPVGFVLTSR